MTVWHVRQYFRLGGFSLDAAELAEFVNVPMTPENVYRPPAIVPDANHSTFTHDEWRYMAKVFAAWFLGGSLLLAIVETSQFSFALSQFGAQEYTTRLVTMTVFFRHGAGLVIFAACNTLVMVTHRRAKAEILRPVQKLPLWIPGCLGLTTPIAMALICGFSLAIITYWIGLPSADSWNHMQGVIRWVDVASSILSVMVVTALLVALVPQIMRLLFRFRGWLILKLIIMAPVTGLVLAVVRPVWKAILSL